MKSYLIAFILIVGCFGLYQVERAIDRNTAAIEQAGLHQAYFPCAEDAALMYTPASPDRVTCVSEEALISR